MKNELPISEELDFHYLLALIPPLTNLDEFAWLPELFSIIGYEKLVKLCRYAGGEVIRIPTIEQLADSIEALQWFYDVYITNKLSESEIPSTIKPLVLKVANVYAENDKG